MTNVIDFCQDQKRPLDGELPAIAELIASGPRFVTWRSEFDGGKHTKVPYRVHGNGKASCSNPATWSTFDEAIARYGQGDRDGIGFVPGNGIVVIDLDCCIDPTSGEIADWAQEIVDNLNSYTEISPSGTGLKVFAREGSAVNWIRKCLKIEGAPKLSDGHDPQVQLITTYTTITGQHFADSPIEIRDATDALIDLAQRIACSTGSAPEASDQPSWWQADLLLRAAETIPNDDLLWEEWNNVGMRFWAANSGPDGLAAFEAFSAKSTKYIARTTHDRWAHYHRSPPSMYTAESLLRAARKIDSGFPDPRVAHGAEVSAALLANHPGANGAAGAAEDENDPFEFVMLKDLSIDTDVFWAVEDVLPRCSQAMVYGLGGSGKTYLASSLALGIGCGEWFGHVAEKGAVLICAFERPQDAGDRLAALRDRMNLPQDTPVALLKLAGRKLDQLVCKNIIRKARQLAEETGQPVRAIVIDTVSASLGGAKEDEEGLGRLRMCGETMHAETDAMIVWVHHAGKSEGMGPRGSTVLADACLLWWRVEERVNGDRVVHVEKSNRGPSHIPLLAFRLAKFVAGQDKRGKDITLCEPEPTILEAALEGPVRIRFGANPKSTNAKMGSRQKLMLRLAQKLSASHPDGIEIAALRSLFILELNEQRKRLGEQPMGQDAARPAFQQTLKSLKEKDLIRAGENDLLIVP